MKEQKQLQKPSNLKALDTKCHIQKKICSLQQQREILFKLLGPVQPELGFEICSFLHHQLIPSDHVSQSTCCIH